MTKRRKLLPQDKVRCGETGYFAVPGEYPYKGSVNLVYKDMVSITLDSGKQVVHSRSEIKALPKQPIESYYNIDKDLLLAIYS